MTPKIKFFIEKKNKEECALVLFKIRKKDSMSKIMESSANIFSIHMKAGTLELITMDLNTTMAAKLLLSINNATGLSRSIQIISTGL